MRYGVMIPNWAPFEQETILELALEAEALGFDHAFFSDHLLNPYIAHTGVEGAVEVWSLISHVAAKTSTIRLGTAVTPMSLRPPSLLAKQVATIDNLSGGRIDLGLGSGWAPMSYRAAEAEFGTASSRREQLAEGIEIIRRLWAGEDLSFAGEHYQLSGARVYPGPAQQPGPPIWIGATGPKMLALTAAHGDGWLPWNRPPDAYRELRQRLAGELAARGRAEAEMTYGIAALVLPDRLAGEPHFLVKPGYARATPASLPEAVREYEEAGAETWVCFPYPPEDGLEILRAAARALIR